MVVGKPPLWLGGLGKCLGKKYETEQHVKKEDSGFRQFRYKHKVEFKANFPYRELFRKQHRKSWSNLSQNPFFTN